MSPSRILTSAWPNIWKSSHFKYLGRLDFFQKGSPASVEMSEIGTFRFLASRFPAEC
jgi:hypothetical protein